MEEFPIIHTNFWDAILAVPIVVILTQIIKVWLHIKPVLVPTIANIIGLLISIFFAHKNNIWAGIFMGFFYGNASVGVYASLKTSLITFKKKRLQK
ncbi:hypothetical protein [Paraliobacillus salinarum]|uniref:hypothetical protein n=1 Tax=Paraliobacillus salinarum TaxID=1158996 RepID=UPI0015F55C8C|nr:hypothetical protein [Paraliobacillus salinarum]